VRRKPAVVVASALTAAALVALSACGSSSTNADGPGGNTSSPAKGGVSKVDVKLVSGGSGDVCQLSTASVPAGPVTFSVDNVSATAVNEVELLSDQRILGEKENLAPGLGTETFTVTLGGGTYQVYCPGAAQEMTNLTVTGQAAPAATGSVAQLLQQGATQYATYATAQITAMVSATQKLQQAVDAGDLHQAQVDYAEARPYYERVESDVDGFVLPGFKATDNAGNLDYLIDMRASNLDPKVGWSGFHAVERDLFKDKKIDAGTKQYAAKLTQHVKDLDSISKGLTYKPEDLANGAADLLDEVQSSKITGEEEDFSHIDLVDFAANVEGAEEAFAYLRPGLNKIDASLAATVAQRFNDVDTMLDGYRDAKALGGYVRYTPAVKAKDANKLSQTVQALQDVLSSIATKVATNS